MTGTAVAAAAARLDRWADDLERALTPLAGPVTGWTGAAAEAAARAGSGLAARGRALVVEVRTVAEASRATAPDAAGADAALATVLDVAGAPTSGPPSVGAAQAGSAAAGLDPEAVARWWAGLDPAVREALERTRPTLVGGLDGVPAVVRDRANRTVLDAAQASARDEEQLLRMRLAAARDPRDLAALGGELHDVRRRLERLGAVAAGLDRPGRALLALEVEPAGGAGDGVRAAVAVGDVDRAAHIGVFTPGFAAGVDELPARLGDLGTVAAAAGPDTAMVAWYGYDAPQVDEVLDPARSVLSEAPARAGATRLAGFLDGLDAARPVDAHVTAVGHSYGSVVTGAAVRPGGADGVDDVVYTGSPGVGPDAGRPPGHAWVVEAAGDPVADTGWFGPDPNRLPGATGLSTREVALPDGTVLAESRGHHEYLTPGTTSSHNVAAVVGGHPERAVLDRGLDAGDRLRRAVGG